MPRGINFNTIIQRFVANGYVNQGLIAVWTNRGGMTAYLIFKQLKDLCEDGFFNDDTQVCEVRDGNLVLRKVNGSNAGPQSQDQEDEFLEYVKELKEGNYEVVE